MKNIITVIYPDSHKFAFIIESNATMDNPDNHDYLLERVFAEWNHGSQVESELFLRSNVRSMSVGDIVLVNGTYYQCMPIGWKKVSTEYVVDLERRVHDHPYRNLHGAWSALNAVSWGSYMTENRSV